MFQLPVESYKPEDYCHFICAPYVCYSGQITPAPLCLSSWTLESEYCHNKEQYAWKRIPVPCFFFFFDRRKNNSKPAETPQQQKNCDILHQSEDELSFYVVAGGCWAGRSSRTDARLPEETFLFSEAAAVLGTSYLLPPRFTLKNIARWFKDFLQCNKNSYLNISSQSIENTASEGLLPSSSSYFTY